MYGHGAPSRGETMCTDDIDGDKTKTKRFYCRAIMDYIGGDEDQLDLKENGIFYILEVMESGWWFGIDENGNDGWMPSNYLEKCSLSEQKEIRRQQKQQTDIGDLIGNKMDNYLLNVDKYLNIVLPPIVSIENVGNINTDNGLDEFSSSSDSDIDYQTGG